MFLVILKFKQNFVTNNGSKKNHCWNFLEPLFVTKRKIKDSMNVQKEEKVEDLLELLMRGEEWTIVEDSFDKIQEQKQDDNEEKVSSI